MKRREFRSNRLEYLDNAEEDGILRIAAGYTRSIDEKKRTVRAVLSSETVDRYGDVILASSFDTPENHKNYFKGNPVMCWAHNQDCTRNLPIGSIHNPSFSEKDINGNLAFMGDAVFAETKDAEDVWQLYRQEHLRCFSVGFRPIETSFEPIKEGQTGYTFKIVDLLENSAVPIPANPAAMRKAFLDGSVSEEFLYNTFFRMRDTLLTRKTNIFIPTDWKYKESCNELAIMAAEVRDAGFREVRRSLGDPKEKKDEKKEPVPGFEMVPVKEAYACQNCDKLSEVVMTAFEEKSYVGTISNGETVTYRNVKCEHCQQTAEQCIEAIEFLSSKS